MCDAYKETCFSGKNVYIICYYKPESKGQSMGWKHPDSLGKEKVNQGQLTIKKIILTVFWDITIELLEKADIVNCVSHY